MWKGAFSTEIAGVQGHQLVGYFGVGASWFSYLYPVFSQQRYIYTRIL